MTREDAYNTDRKSKASAARTDTLAQQKERRARIDRKRFNAALAAILVIAAAIRLYRLDHFSYGLDEILQAYWIQGDWAFFWKSLKFDAVHPPLDYLVARMVEYLAPADWARKLPAVFWGLGTIGVLAALIRRRAGGGEEPA